MESGWVSIFPKIEINAERMGIHNLIIGRFEGGFGGLAGSQLQSGK